MDFLSWENAHRDSKLLNNKRYENGEPRLRRLNVIYQLTGRGLTCFTVHRTYKTYFAQYSSEQFFDSYLKSRN